MRLGEEFRDVQVTIEIKVTGDRFMEEPGTGCDHGIAAEVRETTQSIGPFGPGEHGVLTSGADQRGSPSGDEEASTVKGDWWHRGVFAQDHFERRDIP
jgi:hypothetical protein